MNPADAAELGIAQGDTVLATSKTGKILRPASLTETIMPGVVALPHGNWLDYDEKRASTTADATTRKQDKKTGRNTGRLL